VYKVECVKANIIETENQVDQVYYHSVSHTLGLDTHDVGLVEGAVLKPGMVITVEPGLYSEKESIGIRIEDDILVTKTGFENLSEAIAIDL
jgi:Xaa-Pro aminopeptidase